MKKIMALVIVGSFALAMVSCDGGKKAQEALAKAKADSTRVADSLATIKAEADAMAAAIEAQAKAVADSIAKADSVAQAAMKKKK